MSAEPDWTRFVRDDRAASAVWHLMTDGGSRTNGVKSEPGSNMIELDIDGKRVTVTIHVAGERPIPAEA